MKAIEMFRGLTSSVEPDWHNSGARMTQGISAQLEALPDTPLGEQLRWYLSMLLTAGEGSSLADVSRYVPRPELRLENIRSDEDVHNNWKGTANRIGT